ncbi:MAG: hypothetical protein RSA70_00380 [Clostridia bacterium]
MKRIRTFFNSLNPIFRYMSYSAFVTVLDVSTVWIMVQLLGVPLVISNTSGMIIGFVVHYLLASKSVFSTSFGIYGFIIYLATFILGICIANVLIVFCTSHIFASLDGNLRLLISKAVSMLIPFFILYGIRRVAFAQLAKHWK